MADVETADLTEDDSGAANMLLDFWVLSAGDGVVLDVFGRALFPP
jgi:hypothetical protein